MAENKDLVKRELIGTYIEITDSKNPTLKGLKGKIINETKNIFTIKTEKGEKKLIKNQIKMLIKENNKKIEIEGSKLVGRLEDRLKK